MNQATVSQHLETHIQRLEQERDRDRRTIDVLYRVSLACRGVASDRAIFDVLRHELEAVFPLDSCFIALCDVERPEIFRTALLYDEGLLEYVEGSEFGPITGRLIRERSAILIPDLNEYRATLNQYPTTFGNTQKLSRSWMGVPLLLGQDALGIISLQSYTPNRFTEDDLALLQRLGDIVAIALENVNLLQHQRKLSGELSERVAARTDELTALGAIAAEMVLQHPLPELVDRALARILELLDVRGGNVRLLNAEGDALELLAQHNIPLDDPRAVATVPLIGSRLGVIVNENRPLVIERDLPYQTLNPDPSLFDSLLGIPLRIGSQVIGTMSLMDARSRTFTPQEIDLAQLIANQLAIAIENTRLLEQRDRQIRELRALGTISHAANTSLNLRMLLRKVYEVLDELMPQLDAFVMSIYDPEREVVIEGIGIDEGETYEYYSSNEPLPPESFSAWIVRNRQALHMRNVAEELPNYPDLENLLAGSGRPAVSWLGVPLFDRDEYVIGTIIVQSYTEAAFDDDNQRFLERIAQQAALHVRNMLLLRERERQIRELDAIGQIGQHISASFDLDDMLGVVHRTVTEITDAPIFYMLLCEPVSHRVTNAIFIEQGKRHDLGWVGSAPTPNSMTDWVLRNREPLLYDDLLGYLEESSNPAVSPRRFGQQNHARSWAGVPLVAEDGESIGVLSVQDYEPHLYDAGTLDFLSQVATHITLGVQKVRLLRERERQIRELGAIGRIGRLVSASFDLETMLQVVYEILQQVTGAAAFYQVVCEPGSLRIAQAFYIERGTRYEDNWPGVVPPADSLTGWILRRREALLFNNLPEERERLEGLGINPVFMNNTVTPRSWIGVPLLADDAEPIGAISVQDEQVGRFDEQTVEFLSQVASHLSLGVQKIQLFEEREREVAKNAELFTQAQSHAAAFKQQANRLALVHRLSLALSGRFDTQEILDLAVKELGPLFEADHTGIVLFDEATGRSTVVAEYPNGGALGLELPLDDNPITQRLLATRQPLVIDDLASDPMAVSVRDYLEPLGVQSIMIVPLISRDRVIGSIGVDSMGQTKQFTTEDQELFLTVAAAVAAAFENARLFAAEHDARSTADTLREVARVLSSTFDANEVLDLILDQLRRVIAYDSASIMLAEGSMLYAVAQRGLDTDAALSTQSFSLNSPSGAGLAVRRREPVVINDTAASPDWQVHNVGKHIRSWLGVPLLSKGRVLGVLNIDSHQPNHFLERDVEVALAFANQAAVALENAQLYQQSVTRVEQELEIARRIQSNLFPRELPTVAGVQVAARALPARETGGDFYDVVALGDRTLGLIIGDASGKSIPAAMLMAVARSIARSEAHDHELPETVVRETNRWIVRDVPARSFVALSYARFDAGTRHLVMANAGQLSPLRRASDGGVTYLDVPGATLPLGITPDTGYEALDIALEPGDTLVFYTDGVVEARNHERDMFGFERLEALVRDYGDREPGALIDEILAAVRAFCGDTAQHDDITMMVMHVE